VSRSAWYDWQKRQGQPAKDGRVRAEIRALHAEHKGRYGRPRLTAQLRRKQYQALLSQHQGRCSMSRKGNCWDNAVVESFFHTLKVECLYLRRWESLAEVADAISAYIHGYYNTKRLHSHNQWRTPNEAERLFSPSTPSLAA
jgi:transposase InsO family protein